jgi:hypothetical protein
MRPHTLVVRLAQSALIHRRFLTGACEGATDRNICSRIHNRVWPGIFVASSSVRAMYDGGKCGRLLRRIARSRLPVSTRQTI